MRTALIQTGAMLLDAYRELNSRKLFWITLVLSLLFVVALGSLGINEKGLTLLHWQFDTPFFTNALIPEKDFYAFLFANFAVPVWLTWAATILALVSTASIIPDFLAGGAVELTLSKPIGRVRLYLTRFFTGLLFAALQVTIFSLAWFILMIVRAGSWNFTVFLAVPIVVLMFSYLFCICAFIGLLTRSTIAALLLTLLAWLGLFAVNSADNILLGQRETAIVNLERAERRAEARLAAARKMWNERHEDAASRPEPTLDELEKFHLPYGIAREDAREAEQTARKWKRWAGIMIVCKTALPKTDDTIKLLGRYLISKEMAETIARRQGEDVDEEQRAMFGRPDKEVLARIEAATRSRTVGWIIGTSMGFEVVLLAISCWIFARRDF